MTIRFTYLPTKAHNPTSPNSRFCTPSTFIFHLVWAGGNFSARNAWVRTHGGRFEAEEERASERVQPAHSSHRGADMADPPGAPSRLHYCDGHRCIPSFAATPSSKSRQIFTSTPRLIMLSSFVAKRPGRHLLYLHGHTRYQLFIHANCGPSKRGENAMRPSLRRPQ